MPEKLDLFQPSCRLQGPNETQNVIVQAQRYHKRLSKEKAEKGLVCNSMSCMILGQNELASTVESLIRRKGPVSCLDLALPALFAVMNRGTTS